MTSGSFRDLTRDELYSAVWAEPVEQVAARFGVSGVALAKYCRRQQIPIPPRGYWARKAAGQPVEAAPLPELPPPDPVATPISYLPRPRRKAGIYLVGHGPLREPRLIELQRLRLDRYREAIAAELDFSVDLVDTFVDLNWPRAIGPDPENFSNLVRLCGAIQAQEIDTVLIDVAPGDPRQWVPYDMIVHKLTNAGARVLNAYFDDEGALRKAIVRLFGEHAAMLVQTGSSDCSDVATFFPALASAVAMEVIDGETMNNALLAPTLRHLHHLRESNPYSSGRVPFLSEDLMVRLGRRKQEWETENKAARRRDGERLFRVHPTEPPVLIDELGWPYGRRTRTEDELKWAESRVVDDLGFNKRIDGVVVSYEKTRESVLGLADVRASGVITIRLFRVPVPRKPRRAYAGGRANELPILDTRKHKMLEQVDAFIDQYAKEPDGGRR